MFSLAHARRPKALVAIPAKVWRGVRHAHPLAAFLFADA